jgi:carbonic anhydrase
VRKTSVLELTSRFKAMGVERGQLPGNLNEYFGLFASERQNVLRGVEQVRASPLIGPTVPVHGVLVDIETGRLEWLVNGYQTLGTAVSHLGPSLLSPMMAATELGANVPPLTATEWKSPPDNAPEVSGPLKEWLPKLRLVEAAEQDSPPPPARPPSKPIPVPPPIRPGGSPGKNPKGRR